MSTDDESDQINQGTVRMADATEDKQKKFYIFVLVTKRKKYFDESQARSQPMNLLFLRPYN